MRLDGRDHCTLRSIEFIPGFSAYAEGSCLVKYGNTHILCTASVDEGVPYFLRNSGKGWVTAEYGMLPRSTHKRCNREAAHGKQSGRTQEIQRLIGRSLRAVIDLAKLGERQIKIDCDVLQADGGTRTAAITGSYVALYMAVKHMMNKGLITQMPLTSSLAAVSCGLVNDKVVLDLNYEEDSKAEADANFVMTGSGKVVEIQCSAEASPFSQDHFLQMLQLAQQGIDQIIAAQTKVIMGLYND